MSYSEVIPAETNLLGKKKKIKPTGTVLQQLAVTQPGKILSRVSD
jgi:hypothetical protein